MAADAPSITEFLALRDSISRDRPGFIAAVEHGGFAKGSAGLAGILFNVFLAGARKTAGTPDADVPWGLVRAIAGDLALETQSAGAARIMLKSLLELADPAPSPELRAEIEADLRRIVIQEHAKAIEDLIANDFDAAERRIDELLAKEDEPKDIAQLTSLRDRINTARRVSARQRTRAIWLAGALLAGTVALLLLTAETPPPAPAQTNLLTRDQLLACQGDYALLQSVAPRIPGEDDYFAERYRAAVAAYTKRCADRTYRPEDLADITAQLAKTDFSAAAGKLLEDWRAARPTGTN